MLKEAAPSDALRPLQLEVSPVALPSLQMALPSCLLATKEAVHQAPTRAVLSPFTETKKKNVVSV